MQLGQALACHETFAGLLRRLQESNARYERVRHLLAPALAPLVRPGSLDDTAWTLTVGSGAAAAKLRQCLPALAKALRDDGWPDVPIRIKVSMAPAPPARR